MFGEHQRKFEIVETLPQQKQDDTTRRHSNSNNSELIKKVIVFLFCFQSKKVVKNYFFKLNIE
jgi:hypothetical protein